MSAHGSFGAERTNPSSALPGSFLEKIYGQHLGCPTVGGFLKMYLAVVDVERTACLTRAIASVYQPQLFERYWHHRLHLDNAAAQTQTGPDPRYDEVIDCVRTFLLLTGVLFCIHGTAGRAAMACIFAFASHLGLEVGRPQLDPEDQWPHRLVSSISAFVAGWLRTRLKTLY